MEPIKADSILQLTDDMRSFAHGNVPAIASNFEKLRALLFALTVTGRLNLGYEERTRSAAETFELRRGNCLSFTNMFVALARELRIPVSFQEVEVPPSWVREGESVVVSRHMNAAVLIDSIGEHVVDFNMSDFRIAYPRHRVSDTRGLAHFYSNIGAERMLAHDSRGALSAFVASIAEDSGFAPAWNNLGLLYLRAGARDYAESAWLHALATTPGDFSLLSNLEHLYALEGRDAEAQHLAHEVERYRLRNPYYRYWLAQRALDNGDLAESAAQLRVAVREQPQDDAFYALLALVAARQSDTVAAKRWLAKAAEVSGDDEHRKAYDRKLELLRAAAVGG